MCLSVFQGISLDLYATLFIDCAPLIVFFIRNLLCSDCAFVVPFVFQVGVLSLPSTQRYDAIVPDYSYRLIISLSVNSSRDDDDNDDDDGDSDDDDDDDR